MSAQQRSQSEIEELAAMCAANTARWAPIEALLPTCQPDPPRPETDWRAVAAETLADDRERNQRDEDRRARI